MTLRVLADIACLSEVQVDGQSIRLDDGEARAWKHAIRSCTLGLLSRSSETEGNERKRAFTVDEVIDSRESDGSQ
eukprot:1779638-Amphidinium_carterae.1